MAKRKKLKSKAKSIGKGKARSGSPLSAFALLIGGVLIAVLGSTTIPALLPEDHEAWAVGIAILSLGIGIYLALLGVRRLSMTGKRR